MMTIPSNYDKVMFKTRACAAVMRRNGVNMKTIIERITDEVKQAFIEKGFEEKYGIVTISNRPDLCQYQCNGALAAAKQYRTAPIAIANEIVDSLKESKTFQEVCAIMPGFINITVSDTFLAEYLNNMSNSDRFGFEKESSPKKILIDYGGPNIAKPLHIGHMRSAVIGESIKRLLRFCGNEVIGDVHLGDWGTQMGLIIAELKRRKPDLVYFDDSFSGEYPEAAPFTITELEEIYPAASEYSKANPEFREEAKQITYQLQNGHRGYTAIWNHMMEVSVTDIKRIYKTLNVSFDLWKKESDVQPYIPDMVQYLKDNGYTRISEGALVVDVKEETDTREIPPCIILKTDGASLYNTTDLATIVERMKLFHPDHLIYITDKRQELYFETVFRCAKKAKLVDTDTELTHIGYGTMNGKDGKPFKTREGGVMRLENLIKNVNDEVYQKIMANRTMEEEEAKEIAALVGLAALKYGDLSNQISKDYIFDIDRFTSFEGDTGPYILYTIVRIKSILAKYREMNKEEQTPAGILPATSQLERTLMLELVKFSETLRSAYEELAPHRICSYIYDLADTFNRFYHDTKIITEEDANKQGSWIALISLIQDVLLTCIELLGFTAPDRM